MITINQKQNIKTNKSKIKNGKKALKRKNKQLERYITNENKNEKQ